MYKGMALSSLHVRWLNVLVEFKYTVAHIPGKPNVADHLTRQYRVGAGVSGAAGTSDLAAAGAAFACAVLSGLPTSAPRLLRMDFGANLQRALQNDPFLGDLAVEVQASHDLTDSRGGRCSSGATVACGVVRLMGTGCAFLTMWGCGAQCWRSCTLRRSAGTLAASARLLWPGALSTLAASARLLWPGALSGGLPYPGTWRPLYGRVLRVSVSMNNSVVSSNSTPSILSPNNTPSIFSRRGTSSHVYPDTSVLSVRRHSTCKPSKSN